MSRFHHLGRSVFPALVTVALIGASIAPARAADLAADLNLDATDEQAIAWFPESGGLDLTLRPPVHLAAAPTAPIQDARAEQALIPLPPAAWTGLAALAALTLPTCRRMLYRIVR